MQFTLNSTKAMKRTWIVIDFRMPIFVDVRQIVCYKVSIW